MTSNNRRAELTIEVRSAVNAMTAHLRKALGNDKWSAETRLRFDGSKSRRSWGGLRARRGKHVPFISLAMSYYLSCTTTTFHEYKSFAGDKQIGSVKDVPVSKAIWALVAHELAHAAQWSIVFGLADKRAVKYAHGGTSDRGHGALWQSIYRDLRQTFVNGDCEMNATTNTTTPTVVEETAPVKPEPRVTNRAKINAIVDANRDKRTSEVVAICMESLGISKSYAYTYVYLARKDLGIESKGRVAAPVAVAEPPAAAEPPKAEEAPAAPKRVRKAKPVVVTEETVLEPA